MNQNNRLRRDEDGIKFFPEEDNVPMCSIFGCRNHLSLQEQMYGSVCVGCCRVGLRTIKSDCPDYKVKPQKNPKHAPLPQNNPVKEEKGKRYAALGFGGSYNKAPYFPKSKNNW